MTSSSLEMLPAPCLPTAACREDVAQTLKDTASRAGHPLPWCWDCGLLELVSLVFHPSDKAPHGCGCSGAHTQPVSKTTHPLHVHQCGRALARRPCIPSWSPEGCLGSVLCRGVFMECGHLCQCSAMAFLSWDLFWALGSTGGEQQDWGRDGE